MKNPHRILFALVACSITVPALASVSASLDRNSIGAGETVQLRLQHDGSTDSQPELGPLKRDFDVLGSSRGSNVQIINGHMSSQAQVVVLLSPKHDGKIQIPPLQWDGQQSPMIELSVSASGGATPPGGQAATADASHVFLTATLDQKQPYVQAADVLTVRLYTDLPLSQASLDLPASGDVLVQQLGKDVQSNETRNGRNYQVVERKYLLFPQHSGKLSLNGPVLDAQVPDTSNNNDPFGNFFGQMPLARMLNAARPIRLHAKSIELNVLARPAGATGANWLPAQNVSLEESWRPDATSIHVGEPLTRHLHVAALGLTGAQLPDLSALISAPDGIKTYPDQSKSDDAVKGDTVLGSRDQDIALIATRAGRFELPALRLSWWDTVHNMQHVAMLPARVLDVLPAIGGSIAATLPPATHSEGQSQKPDMAIQSGASEQVSNNAKTTPWIWGSVVLALLWLGTAAAWWYSRRGSRQTPTKKIDDPGSAEKMNASAAFKAFKKACQQNDPHTARKQLLAWAGATWPTHPPVGLNDLARRLGDAELIQALRELDRACYTGNPWQGESLGKLLPNPPAQKRTAENQPALPALYS